MKQPSITVIGPGRLGSTLVQQLHSAGCHVAEIICRENSLAPARALARQVGARARTLRSAQLDAEIIWICVPDSQIKSLADTLSSASWDGKIAVHSSGVLSSDVLAGIRKAGASVASAHPLMTFIRSSIPDLTGVPFAIEGDGRALPIVKDVVRRLKGRPVAIRKQDKPAYHLFASMICPLLISLFATAEKAGKLAGLSAPEGRRRMLPILRQTISNYEKVGAAAAFTGPFVRGDVSTVRQHLNALSRTPGVRKAYIALAEAALHNLPHQNATAIRAVLQSAEGAQKGK